MATAVSKSGTNDDNVIFGAGQSEVERLDMQHKVIADHMTQLILAPIDLSKPGLRILDQATGGGAWLRDVRSAATAQHSYVGTDIEDSYFPSDPPADTSYHHQSMTEPWPADWANSFDLVHSRFALPGVGTHPVQETVKNLITLVKPGGYIQLVEMEYGGWDVGPAGKVFYRAFRDLLNMVSAGQGVDMREKLGVMFQEAGLEDVNYRILAIPIGIRAKSEEIKELSVASMFATASGVKETTKMLPPISVSREELDAMPDNLAKEARDQGGEFRVFVLWGRKPLTA